MRIVVAPDKFKGSLSAKEVAEAIGRGIMRAAPDSIVDLVPMADGGEGTVEALVTATGGHKIPTWTTGPLGGRVEACLGVFDSADGIKTGVIEMASASGLGLVIGDNRPLEASTYGTGELILAALENNCRRLIVGLGGSATTDGGTGMATALGARFLDFDGNCLAPGGGDLGTLEAIDISHLDSRLHDMAVLAACDVDNPLYGPNGAAYIYAPQKGATPAQVKILDAALQKLARIIKSDLNIDISLVPGAGAAGGLGAGLVAFTGASLRSGVDLISEAIDLPARIKGADLVFVGEGRIDGQTVRGKAPIGVAKQAKAADVPVIAIVGSIGDGAEAVYDHGITEMVSIYADSTVTAEANKNTAAELVEKTAETIMRTHS